MILKNLENSVDFSKLSKTPHQADKNASTSPNKMTKSPPNDFSLTNSIVNGFYLGSDCQLASLDNSSSLASAKPGNFAFLSLKTSDNIEMPNDSNPHNSILWESGKKWKNPGTSFSSSSMTRTPGTHLTSSILGVTETIDAPVISPSSPLLTETLHDYLNNDHCAHDLHCLMKSTIPLPLNVAQGWASTEAGGKHSSSSSGPLPADVSPNVNSPEHPSLKSKRSLTEPIFDIAQSTGFLSDLNDNHQ